MNTTAAALADLATTTDLLEKGLKLAGLVTRVFAEAGWELVVVGGSAVEFYTEGAYMSGDVDFCRKTLAPIPPRTAQDVMGQLGAEGGPRSWKVAGLYVDLLGLVENEARTPYRLVETPNGAIRLIPLELAIVERALLAFYPQNDGAARQVALSLLAVCQREPVSVDWNEVERIAALPSFRITAELLQLRREAADVLRR